MFKGLSIHVASKSVTDLKRTNSNLIKYLQSNESVETVKALLVNVYLFTTTSRKIV